MRVLVTGAKGMLGHRVVAEARGRGHEAQGTDLPELDLTDPEAVRAVIDREAPDVVIHCAAYTDVDGAEADEDQALRVNVLGSRNVAVAAPYVVAVSTDYVFSGDGTRPYLESDATGPQGAYGRTKLAGEQEILAANPAHAIVRTQWLYGAGGKNFVDTIVRAAGERDELRVVCDQHGTPTWTGHLAPVLLDVAERRGAGIFHAAGGGQTTWHGLAVEALRVAGIGTPVREVTSQEFARAAPRPAYSVLGTEREDGIAMPDWQDGVIAHLKEVGRA